VVAPLNRRYGMGRTMLGGIAGTGLAWLVMGSAMGPPWLAGILFAGGMFLLDLGAMIFFINYLSIRQAATPDRILGRVTATMICLTVSTAPLGAITGGWIAEHLGLRSAMLFCGVGCLMLAPLIAWLSPIAAMHDLPKPQEPRAMESVAEELAGG
jgi:MFS family permease